MLRRWSLAFPPADNNAPREHRHDRSSTGSTDLADAVVAVILLGLYVASACPDEHDRAGSPPHQCLGGDTNADTPTII